MQFVRSGWWRAIVSLAAVTILVAPAASAQTPEGATVTGATIEKTGWWTQSNPGVEGPTGIVETPPPPSVPAKALPVSATAGEIDKISAIGIIPEALAGATVTSFTLTVAESEAPGANTNADSEDITVQACPITGFWSGGENRPFRQVPTFDCDLAAAEGERDDEGVWTFDLTPIGTAWLDPFSTAPPDGIVLVPVVEPPTTFQVAYDSATIVVEFEFTPAGEETIAPPADVIDSGTTGDFGAGSGVVSTFDDTDSGTVDVPAVEAPTTTAAPAAAPPAEVATAPIANGRPGFLEGLGAGLLFVPIFLAVMFAASFALGPAGEPDVVVRERGVSRALAARERAL